MTVIGVSIPVWNPYGTVTITTEAHPRPATAADSSSNATSAALNEPDASSPGSPTAADYALGDLLAEVIG